MLFNSPEFLFLFLPIAFGAYLCALHWSSGYVAKSILLFASLFFYTWWNWRFLPILLASYLLNYAFGRGLAGCEGRARLRLLAVAIFANLAALAYFKYVGFIATTTNQFIGTELIVPQVLLPLGVSFFTFHQITYLVHVHRTGEAERDPVVYGLFVAFFPQLLAGPITYAREMVPQFKVPPRVQSLDIAVGLAIFSIGLFKKIMLADNVAPISDQLFYAANHGVLPSAADAWIGVFAWTFQIYFDFSGYSDMAIGLARLFGYNLPLNFHSPYKAASIIEFWRRWHISLSRFLRDYLYIPLGGNRHGASRRYINLFVTMLLGGLWHGAGWTFVIWGGLHGGFLVINHLWRAAGWRCPVWVAAPVTFLAVVFAWVYFKAESVAHAHTILYAMIGTYSLAPSLAIGREAMIWIAVCAVLVWFTPNTQQIIGTFSRAIDTYDQLKSTRQIWMPSPLWGAICATTLAVSLLAFERPVRFLYFQF
jgi:alginate O-acetyltransferase complex protein AlgI